MRFHGDIPHVGVKKPSNRAQAEALLGEIAELHHRRDGHAVALNGEVQLARLRHEPVIAHLDKDIEEKAKVLEEWVETQDLGAKKSLRMLGGVVGYKTSPPKLALLSRWTWDSVLEVLQKKWRSYVRLHPEVDKMQIKRDHKLGKISEADLKAMGCKIESQDRFFIDVNKAIPANVVTHTIRACAEATESSRHN